MVNEVASATGRRKTAVARARLSAGTGTVKINDREMDEYFPDEAVRTFMLQPLAITETREKFDIEVVAKGGGTTSQAGAVRHALARALCAYDNGFREPLKAAGCLTRDPRMKERKKPGQPGARKRFQFSKR